MKKLKVEDAVGRELCHDVTGIFPDGKKGAMFKRGHIIREDDIPRLLDIGKSHIFVWSQEADEVHEDDAALLAAEAVCGCGVIYDKQPSEGKVLMTAQYRGLFRADAEALRKINAIGDYTLASLPGFTDVSEGQKLGGIRIVPLVTERRTVDEMLKIARADGHVFSVLPYRALKCGLIITGSEVYYGRIEDKFEPVMTKKFGKFGAEFLGAVKCPDDLDALSSAITGFIEKDADLIVLTGGMSVDPDDLTPSAIKNSGARTVIRGVPMQPGNMLTVAYLGKTVLMGVPGASLHNPVTSFDVFLPRVFAGIEITEADKYGLGAGGFCSGCGTCTYPRCYFGRGG